MKYSNPNVPSSYQQNDLGRTLYELVLDLKPKVIVEFGALHGYSTIAMAMALDKLGRGIIKSYDLWEKYPYKHTTREDTMFNIKSYGLEKYVELHYGDFWKWKPEKCDLFYIDISNTGETIKKAEKKMRKYAKRIVFEGGSEQRDCVPWMLENYKKPINGCGVKYDILNPDFPSISIICKK